jgi:ankyrin repeat protein
MPLLAGAALLASPAQAQFSAGYQFLDAVKKKEGEKVENALNQPGSTIVNTRDVSTGETALHLVTQRRDITWLTFLLAKGANPNMRDARGTTPLQLASNLGWLDGVELLVGQKARVDDANDAGETPLIFAVHRRDIAMMRTLLKAGADPDRKDNSGRSARDYAVLAGPSGPMVAEIESSTKPKSQRAGNGPSYGPTF